MTAKTYLSDRLIQAGEKAVLDISMNRTRVDLIPAIVSAAIRELAVRTADGEPAEDFVTWHTGTLQFLAEAIEESGRERS